MYPVAQMISLLAKMIPASLGAALGTLAVLMAAVVPASAVSSLPTQEGLDPLTEKILIALQESGLGRTTTLSVHVADLERGVSYVEINPDRAMVPASNMKLVTTAAALEILGPERTFTTSLEHRAPIESGVLTGDLTIRGGGDPSLGSRFRQDPNAVLGVLEDWAQELRKRGIRSIQGNIVGDGSRYEYQPHATGWEPLEFGEWYSAEVAALNYNENVVDVIWTPGRRPGEAARFQIRPETDHITFSSSVRTGGSRSRQALIRYIRYADSNAIRARGVLPIETEKYDFAAIHDPALYTAKLFEETLVRRGIMVGGVATSRHRVSSRDGSTSAPITLASHESPPLSELINVINRRSQNLYAEVVLREIALASGQAGSFDGGSRAVVDWLVRNRLHRTGFLMIDGSGLSPLNRATTRQLVMLLRHMAQSPNEAMYRESLPVPGGEGTLRTRFEGEDLAGFRATLRAKTGFVDNAHALSGYVKNRRGTEYVFSIIVNDYDSRRTVAARDLVDQIAVMIHESEILP